MRRNGDRNIRPEGARGGLQLRDEASRSTSASAGRQPAAEREPALGRIVNQLQIPAIEFLEPAPPFDGRELFARVGVGIAAETDLTRLPRNARGPESAA